MDIHTFIIEFFKEADPVGLFLYIMGTITVTIIEIFFFKEFTKGLKGENGEFETPEIIIYLFIWLFPHFLMADAFLSKPLSGYGYMFLGALLLFGLAGRWGLEWLIRMKSVFNGPIITEKKEEKPKGDEKDRNIPA